MKNRGYLIFFMVLMISIISIFIFAAGSSTGEVNNQDTDINQSSNITDQNLTQDSYQNVSDDDNKSANIPAKQRNGISDRVKKFTAVEKLKIREACENKTDKKERIKCRLQYIKDHKEEFVVPGKGIPEACRSLTNKAQCIQLHQLSSKCFEQNGKDKNKCFKKLAGFARAKLKDELANKSELSRKYVVLLLYDLQEKLEKAIENEKIDVDKGTEAINKIVEIKEAILAGKSKNEIKPLFQELKIILKELKEAMDTQNV